jgi:hypothetical protein
MTLLHYAVCKAYRHIWLLKQTSCSLHELHHPHPLCSKCALAAYCYILTSEPASKFLQRRVARLLRYLDEHHAA